MGNTRNGFSLLLLFLLAASSLMAGTGSAQAISQPSAPQFSIEAVDYSYDVPTTYSINPYTGNQVTHYGYRVDVIEVKGNIKNQHFTPYTIPDPNSTGNYLNIDFYYDIRYRGHYGGEWRQLYGSYDVDFLKQNYSSEYTNFTADTSNAPGLQEGAVIDFQVRAIVGFETWGGIPFPYRVLNGEESEWSSTLTVTISKDAASSSAYASNIDNSPYPALASSETLTTSTPAATISETPVPAASVPELPFIAALYLLAVTLLMATILSAKRRSGLCQRSQADNQNQDKQRQNSVVESIFQFLCNNWALFNPEPNAEHQDH